MTPPWDGDLELWGGHECTVNRVGDQFRDQTRLSGHHDRSEDLDAFAALGLKTLRYPALWERIAPDAPGSNDWRWTDERLSRLRALGVRPIVGLVHHGSGPRHTDLLDDGFAAGLADHARAVAERYPWIEAWTPVNEPLTTARFAALYGHWHPHRRDETDFWRALLNQIDAVRLAMAVIRAVNPDARLVQTEDIGRTYATPGLEYQAAFDNDRRWMTFDLLTGRVVPGHPLWARLADRGLGRRLEAIAAAPCPPDILGVNHYLTSDRFLDGRRHLHPDDPCAGNGRDRYADVAAVRVLQPASDGLACALTETWERYGRPLAVTEAHNGCTREEQMRWLHEAWRTAGRLRLEGVDIRAVTAWALLGSYDWDSLLTRTTGRYESGAFDVRGGVARPTAVASLLTSLIRGEEPTSPVLRGVGWWRDDRRLLKPADVAPRLAAQSVEMASQAPRILIRGAGAPAEALAAACRARGLAHVTDEAATGEGGVWAVFDVAGRAGRPSPVAAALLSGSVDAVLDRLIDGEAGPGKLGDPALRRAATASTIRRGAWPYPHRRPAMAATLSR